MEAIEFLKQHRVYEDETIYNSVGEMVGSLSQLMEEFAALRQTHVSGCPPERTMELCKAVMDYLGSKLNGDISPSPSLNSVACLAADIMKELRQA